MARTDEPEASARVKTGQVPLLVMDGFMGEDFAAQLCAFAVARREEFRRAVVTRPAVERELDTATRRSLTYEGDLGALATRFLERVEAVDVFGALSIEPPDRPAHEFTLSACRDGDFFLPHSDVVSADNRRFLGYDRLVTLTYYAHVSQARFHGGELVVHSLFGRGEPQAFAPRNDRLVAFPSFAPHEVRKVAQPDAPFAEARFALTCWLGRKLA